MIKQNNFLEATDIKLNAESAQFPSNTFIKNQEIDIEKYFKLKDVEEELGIDLITLFRALKNGIYGKVGNKIEHILAPHLSWYNREIYIFKIKDYGKTWTFSKEELL